MVLMLMLMLIWILRNLSCSDARIGRCRSEHIVELDGGREGPLDRGKTTGETFLEVSALWAPFFDFQERNPSSFPLSIPTLHL